MNILFLSRHDPMDINSWSGTLYHIYHKLKERHQVKIMGTEILRQLELFTKGNLPDSEFITTDRYVKKLNLLLSERINATESDLIFFGDLLYTPFLDVNRPYIHISDMTFEQMKIHLSKPDERNIEPSIHLEQLLLNTANRIIYCSEWIKNRAVETYHLDPDKIDVVELGANIPAPTSYTIDINTDICRLVFIGKEWEGKGGDKLLQVYEILKSDGFPCTLTIIGSGNKEIDIDDSNLTVYPFLDKSKPADLETLCKILSESHFLVLPTKFDAFGIVFCEASAYAVPSITADVGGVSQAVMDGKNGFLLPADATPNDYAEKIKTVFNDKENYLKLRQSSRKEFETRLNWDVWGEKVNKILEDVVNKWKSHE